MTELFLSFDPEQQYAGLGAYFTDSWTINLSSPDRFPILEKEDHDMFNVGGLSMKCFVN